jgi:recombination protein RecA
MHWPILLSEHMHSKGRALETLEHLFAGNDLRRAEDTPQASVPHWSREQLSGRLTELSGVGAVASLTSAVGLILDAQLASEPVAWITRPDTLFYPPDVADSGVDLDALVLVKVSDAYGAARAAERLLRSGAFGLVILDLGKDARIPTGVQGRLVNLAKKHDAAVVCLTDKGTESTSIGSMVSLRAEVVRNKLEDGRFRCKVNVLKDKCRGPNWTHSEVVRGPAGLR